MGKVSNELVEMIRRQVADRGIVVWYDPQRAYTAVVRRLNLQDTTILSYEEGFFRLRQQLEPFIEYVTNDGGLRPDADQPPSIVIYVPMARDECEHALIEAETIGVVLEPGSIRPECNTRIGLLVERIFARLAPAKAAHLARQADEGLLSLYDLDRMAEDAGSSATGVLQVIFGQVSVEEIILQFTASDVHDQAISEKNVMEDIKTLFHDELGLDCAPFESSSALREALRRHLLYNDLLLWIPDNDWPETLQQISLPTKPAQQDLIRHVCSAWRNRLDLMAFYVEAAEAVEKAGKLTAIDLPLSHLKLAETFPLLERRWLSHAATQLLGGNTAEVLGITKARKSLFWARQNPAFHMEWLVIESATTVSLETVRIRLDLKQRKWTCDDMVTAYACHAEPWMKMDRASRQMDARYALMEAMDEGATGLEKAVTVIRQQYADTVQTMSSAYAMAASAAEFTSRRFGRQTEIFKTAVQPLLEKDIKIAYFLVDALRFEMAAELREGFGMNYESQIEPLLGQLPGITAIGMAALLPKADQGISLEKKIGGLSVAVAGQTLPSRQARMTWLQEQAGVPTAVYRLGEVTKISPKRKKEIDAVRLVVVTSQEIDRLGEEGGGEEETRVYMDEVLEKLRRAIRSLSRAGVTHFVIAADHGFHFIDAMDPGLSMDSPGGDTVELHPRVWVGYGGGSADGYLRFKASDLELGGSLEVAFPRGLGTFKVKGGVGAYFHGGVSLQEHVLPLITALAKKTGPVVKADIRVKLSMAKAKITNRIFTVMLDAESIGLFPDGERRVRIDMVSGKTEVGSAVAAGYGFEESSRELTIVAGKLNVVTMMIQAMEIPKIVTLRVLDCESQFVLDSMKDIPVELSI